MKISFTRSTMTWWWNDAGVSEMKRAESSYQWPVLNALGVWWRRCWLHSYCYSKCWCIAVLIESTPTQRLNYRTVNTRRCCFRVFSRLLRTFITWKNLKYRTIRILLRLHECLIIKQNLIYSRPDPWDDFVCIIALKLSPILFMNSEVILKNVLNGVWLTGKTRFLILVDHKC